MNYLEGGLELGAKYYSGQIMVVETQNNRLNAPKYKLQFIGTHQSWKSPAQELPITELDWGTFTFTAANLETVWSNHPYQSGGSPLYNLLVNTGPWLGKNYVTVEDMDFFTFYLPWIIKEGFCKLGYTVESNLLTTEYLRRIGLFLFKDNYFAAIENAGEFRAAREYQFYLTQQGQEVIFAPNNDSTDGNFDPYGMYDTSTGEAIILYNVAGEFALTELSFELVDENLDSLQGFADIEVEIIREDLDGNIDVLKTAFFKLTKNIYIVNAYTPRTQFSQGDKVKVTIKAVVISSNNLEAQPQVVVRGGILSNQMDDLNLIPRNTVIDFKELIDPNITFYTLLENVGRILPLRYKTNVLTRTVQIEAEHGFFDWQGNYQDGYFLGNSESEDITPTLDLKKGWTKEFTPPQQKRYLQYQFREHDKDYHAAKALEKTGLPLHSVKITIGKNGSETETIANELFYPTATYYDNFYNGGFNNPEAPQIPVIWNDAPDIENGSPYPKAKSTAIGPRIFYIQGKNTENNKEGNLPVWYFENTEARTDYPKGYQLNQDNATAPNLVFAATTTTKTLRSTFWQNYITQLQNGASLKINAYPHLNQLLAFNERAPLEIKGENLPDEIGGQLAGIYYVQKFAAKTLGIGEHLEASYTLQSQLLGNACDSDTQCSLAADIQFSDLSTPGGGDGIIQVISLTNQAYPVSYTVRTIDGTELLNETIESGLPTVLNQLDAGTYIFTLTDANGCRIQGQDLLLQNCSMQAFVSGASTTSAGGTDGSITLENVLYASYPITLTLKQGLITLQSEEYVSNVFPQTFNDLAAGNYYGILTDQHGCNTSFQIALTDAPTCEAPTGINLIALSSEGATFTWSAAAGSSYTLRHRIEGGSASDWTTIEEVTPPYLITGLDNCETYELQLQQVCSEEEASDWSASQTFAAHCVEETDCGTLDFTLTQNDNQGIEISDLSGYTDNNQISVVVTAFNGDIIGNWSSGLAPNTYTVTITDLCNNCCHHSETIEITDDLFVETDCNTSVGIRLVF